MKRRHGRLKRIAAALLTAAMTIGSIQGKFPLAVQANSGGIENEIAVIKIDTGKLRLAAEAAVDSSKMVIPPQVLMTASVSDTTEGADEATPSEADRATPSEAEKATSSNAKATVSNADKVTTVYELMFELADGSQMNFQTASYELDDPLSLLAEGTEMPDKTSLRVFLEPDMDGYVEEDDSYGYSITGNETLIFMVENESSDTMAYQLRFGDKVTDVLVVESKKEMLRQYRDAVDEEWTSDVIIKEIFTEPEQNAGEKVDQNAEQNTEQNTDQNTDQEVASPGNATAAYRKTSIFERIWDMVFPSITAHAAQTASDNDAEKEETTRTFTVIQDAAGGTRLETTSVSALIKKKLEEVDTQDQSALVSALALDEEDQEEFEAKSSNTSSVAMTAVAYGAVVASVGDTDNFTINLYDYAPDKSGNRWPGAKVINQYLINQSKSLRFGIMPEDTGGDAHINGDSDEEEKYNSYTYTNGTEKKYYNILQGITENPDIITLDTLFPVNVGTNTTVKNSGSDDTAMQIYENVGNDGFLTINDDGYYEFDSSQQQAAFDGTNISATDGTDTSTGFWPFGFQYYYFGMNINVDFYMPSNAKCNDQDMNFRFGGDDDVWVYLTSPDGDQKLVMDIGGIHDAMTGEINFATGCITYFARGAETNFGNSPLIHTIDGSNKYPSVPAASEAGTRDANIYVYLYDDFNKLSEDEQRKYCNGGTEPAVLNFPRTEGVHKLQFYYLERGAGGSNCKIKFNLPISPKSGMTVQKHITGLPETIEGKADQEFKFTLYHSDDLEELGKCHSGIEYDESKVTAENFRITGAGSCVLEEVFDRQYETEYYYLEETMDDESQAAVKWKISNAEVGTGNKTSIQTRSRSDEICFVICENRYDSPVPTVKKQAWKSYEDGSSEAVYDIVLQVTGDSLYRKTPDSTALIEEKKVQNIILTDVLSSEAELYDSEFYVMNGEITAPETGESISFEGGEQVEDESVVSVEQDSVTGQSKICWNVGDELGDGETKTLTFKVKAADGARWMSGSDSGEYPDSGETDTGTYAGQKGYYSNNNAESKLVYGSHTDEEAIPLPKPVIRPADHSLSLKKKIDGEELDPEAEYSFEIHFSVESVQNVEKNLVENDLRIAFLDENGVTKTDKESTFDADEKKLTVTLKKDEQLEIVGLPRFVTGYTIRELQPIYTNYGRHKVILDGISHRCNGEPVQRNTSQSDTEDISVTFTKEGQRDDLVFTNRYEYQYGTVEIHKNLWKDDSCEEAYVPSDAEAFTFRITDVTEEKQGSSGPIYYATAIVPAEGSGTGESGYARITLPVGEYRIEEQSALGYTLLYGTSGSDAKKQQKYVLVTVTSEMTEETPENVTFHNKKDDQGYFTDVSTVVNTVGISGFSQTGDAR